MCYAYPDDERWTGNCYDNVSETVVGGPHPPHHGHKEILIAKPLDVKNDDDDGGVVGVTLQWHSAQQLAPDHSRPRQMGAWYEEEEEA